MKRFSNLWCVVMAGISLAIPMAHAADPALPEALMHKDPNCGCCSAWAEHLEANGFRVKTVAKNTDAGITIAFPQLDVHLDPSVSEAIARLPRAA